MRDSYYQNVGCDKRRQARDGWRPNYELKAPQPQNTLNAQDTYNTVVIIGEWRQVSHNKYFAARMAEVEQTVTSTALD